MSISLTISTLAAVGTPINAADVTTPDNELLAHINNLLNGAQAFDAQLWTNSTATLASDVLSLSSKPRVLVIDTQAAAATDDLSTISNGTAYQQLWIRAASAARVITVKNSVGNIKLNGAADVTLSATSWLLLFYDGTQWSDVFVPAANISSQVCNARLTLTTGVPVTTSNVTAATNLYITPFNGNRIALYDGSSAWTVYTFTEITVSLAGLAADKNYDVFVYLSGGSVVAELVVWTDSLTRATALAKQDGVYVKSGTTTRRYVGTIRTTSTIGQCEDSLTSRFVWNYYNRARRSLIVIDTTDSWTYATATWRSWNNSVANRVNFVRGVNEDETNLNFIGAVASSAGRAQLGIGVDSTSAPTGTFLGASSTTLTTIQANYSGLLAEGLHFLQLLEYATAATTTLYGDFAGVIQSGATGTVLG